MSMLGRDALTLVDRIVVHETDSEKYKQIGRSQLIEIHYKHVGLIGDMVMVMGKQGSG
jgi:sporulation protein YlmC with PRC-barrel domain